MGPIEDYRVGIYNDVCDSAKQCKIEDCLFYDLSEEATKRYLSGCSFEQSLEFLRRKEQMLADLHVKVASEREKHGTERPDKNPDDNRPSINMYFPD